MEIRSATIHTSSQETDQRMSFRFRPRHNAGPRLHSQTTRLVDSTSCCDRVQAEWGSHPPWRPILGDLCPVR
ncbi:hypothetical protein KSP39_PZI014045 [Platanthera zijinensis]|uniref:Uncharacterized protein n=1 Tax=Platanthera zijinensis TaxID=2320716 RepID=A0AAP0BD38_9ASPA